MPEQEPRKISRRRFLIRASNVVVGVGVLSAWGSVADMLAQLGNADEGVETQVNKTDPPLAQTTVDSAEKRVGEFSGNVQKLARDGDKKELETLISQTDMNELQNSYQVLDYERKRQDMIWDIQNRPDTRFWIDLGIGISGVISAVGGEIAATVLERKERRNPIIADFQTEH